MIGLCEIIYNYMESKFAKLVKIDSSALSLIISLDDHQVENSQYWDMQGYMNIYD